MITWLGLIGKMVEFMATKLMEHGMNTALDHKRKAARTFVRLHHIIGELESATHEFMSKIDDPNRDYPLMKGAWLYNLDWEISRLSNEFLHTSEKLEQVLRIFDENLVIALSNLRHSKFSLLVIASESFKYLPTQENQHIEVEYSYPDSQLLSINLEEHYQWLIKNPDFNYDDELEWPQSVLLPLFAGSDYIREGEIHRIGSDGSRADVERLRKILNEHLSIISEANKRLRELIVSHFKLEDVLY